ncbi:46325_t:CDS:2 [Gigaspora margarita]|uniref:46325_t:CDS:1 n=1 Tax=Gigaspora margarita TaxID=4874 RepID=A0ABN7V1F6_GIGMA|nr:46325_t:CDS:2 [Gigaspora margarita]
MITKVLESYYDPKVPGKDALVNLIDSYLKVLDAWISELGKCEKLESQSEKKNACPLKSKTEEKMDLVKEKNERDKKKPMAVLTQEIQNKERKAPTDFICKNALETLFNFEYKVHCSKNRNPEREKTQNKERNSSKLPQELLTIYNALFRKVIQEREGTSNVSAVLVPEGLVLDLIKDYPEETLAKVELEQDKDLSPDPN